MTDADLKRLRDLPAPPPAPPGVKEAAIAAALDAFDRARPSAIVVPLRPNEPKAGLFQGAEHATLRAAVHAAPAAPLRRGFSRRGGLALAASLAVGVIAVPLVLRHLSRSSGPDTASTTSAGATRQVALDAKAAKDPAPAAVARTEGKAGAPDRVAAAPPPPAAVAPPQQAPAPGAEPPMARSARAEVEAARPEPQQSPQGHQRGRTLSAMPPPAVAGAGAVPGAVEARPSSAAPAARPAERAGPTLSDAGQGGKLAQKVAEHEWIKVAERPVTSLSFKLERFAREPLRDALRAGRIPAKNKINIAGLVNDFDYAFVKSKLATQSITATITVVRTPWRSDSHLVHVSFRIPGGSGGIHVAQGMAGAFFKALAGELALNPGYYSSYRLLSHPAPAHSYATNAQPRKGTHSMMAGSPVDAIGHDISFAFVYEALTGSEIISARPASASENNSTAGAAELPRVTTAPLELLRLKYQLPHDQSGVWREEIVFSPRGAAHNFSDSPHDVRLGIAVTAFGLWLAESPAIAGVSLDQIETLAKQAVADPIAPDRLELLEMIRLARTARR